MVAWKRNALRLHQVSGSLATLGMSLVSRTLGQMSIITTQDRKHRSSDAQPS